MRWNIHICPLLRYCPQNTGNVLEVKTLLEGREAANRAFIQQARNMDIFLVTDAAELSSEEWLQVFQLALQ